MEKIKNAYRYAKEKYRLLTTKRYTTLAGTLVFFLIMSIMPLSFWLTLIIGRLPISTENLLSLSVFKSVEKVLTFVQQEALNATTGASVVLVITTLYSATNLFYQIRRSGEIIYDFHEERLGLRLRLGALVLLIIVMAGAVAFLLVFALGSFLISRLLSSAWERVADYALLIALAFLLVLLLNMYICPYKEKAKSFLTGTILTVVAWAIAVAGFSLYLRVGNLSRLYGALSTVIVFLLWLYVLMICFIVGVIFNSEKILKKQEKQTKKHRGIKKKKRAHTVAMKIKLKSSVLVGLCSLLLLFPTPKGELADIAKPYLGMYECTQAKLGSKDCLEKFTYLRLELKDEENFILSYQEKGGKQKQIKGRYAYDKQRGTLTLQDNKGSFQREFPLQRGTLTVSLPVGNTILVLQFEQK